MKAASIVLTVIGALLGPGYYFYCEFFSGRAVGTFHTGERLTLELEPRMNPVAIGISMGPAGSDTNYWMALDEGGQRVAATSFHASSGSNTSAMLHATVTRAGAYQFRIEESAWRGRAVLGVPVKVRRNVRIVDPRIAVTGLLLFVIGLLMNAKYGHDEPL